MLEQVVLAVETAPHNAVYAPFPAGLNPGAAQQVRKSGFESLYLHQAEAVEASLRGEDVVVVTGTNSGKSLCYTIPILHSAFTEPAARALLIYPTKALAQDQQGKLAQALPPSTRIGVYDGDTPKSHRSGIRNQGHVILTNPDMLHIGILPGHENWTRFLKAVRLIVLDEMHVYRGVFGSNVAHVLRRLLRLCEAQRNRPQIIACSATIGNPQELFRNLTGRSATIVDHDGAPQARRTYVFLNPSMSQAVSLGGNVATSQMLTRLVRHGYRTLAFSRARVSAELVLRYARTQLQNEGHPPEEVESYRAGYTAKERRAIEAALFKGKLVGLSSTNSLELGVDIGGLDAVVMNGYPGSVAAFRQQAGRAGRGLREGLAVYIAREDPLDQYLLRDPERLLDGASECVAIRPGNPHILREHLRCAAHERPLAPSELEKFGDTALELAEEMDRTGELAFRGGLFVYPSFEAPTPQVNLRGGGGDTIRLLEGTEELGSMEYWRALQNAHAGAVYLHRGTSYVVDLLDLPNKVAHVHKEDLPYYTKPVVQSVIEPKVQLDQDEVMNVNLAGVSVTTLVSAYRRLAVEGGMVLDVVDLDLPPQTYETLALQFIMPAVHLLDDPDLWTEGVHGVEHALMAVAPLFAGCDRGDLGSAWYSFHPDTASAMAFVYDVTPGGLGLAERLFASRESWVAGAIALLKGCGCTSGCPSCLLSPSCEIGNASLDKACAAALLRGMLPADPARSN